MVYISVRDFFEKADACSPLSREEELRWAQQRKAGDPAAREQLIQGNLPMVAGHIKRMPSHLQTLGLILYCVHALERAVDTFDFLQSSETFAHRLSWYLRQATAAYMVR